MSINKYFLVFITSLVAFAIQAQTNNTTVVATVGEIPISKSEFEYAYNKSLENSGAPQLTPAQFLNSYIDFKLKVLEAKALQLDTTNIFKNEFIRNLSELEKPYLEDTIPSINFAKKIYKRLGEDIEVSDIFIAFPETKNIYPKDTLLAYQTIIDIKNKITHDGSNFEEMTQKYSQDSIIANNSRPGYLGWVTVLMGDESFDSAIYNTPVNSISEPIRTQTGYHLIKVLNKRPDPGLVGIAHILLKYPQDNPTKAQTDSINSLADNIYKELLAGADFSELCEKYSSDPETSLFGGHLGYFGIRRPMSPMFSNAIDGLNAGEYAQPISTNYGVHIVRVSDYKALSPWENMKKDIINYINNGDRKDLVKSEELTRLAKEIPYKLDKSTYTKLANIVQNYAPCEPQFAEKAADISEDVLVHIDKREYKVADYLFFLRTNPTTCNTYNLSTDVLKYTMNDFIFDMLINIKKSSLFDKYPDLANISREYYEGILLFDIMTLEVWDKAQVDKDGLTSFYNKNKKNYKWETPKYEGYLIYAKDAQTIDKAKSLINENKNSSTNLSTLLKENLNTEGVQNIIIEKGLWGKGENEFVDNILYQTPTKKALIGYPEYFLEGELINSPRNMEDVRGHVETDYQLLLEKEWLKSLKKKYQISINKDVLDKLSDKK